MNTRNIIQTNKKWKIKNVDWTKYKEEIGKARSKEEKINNIYKVIRWARERSVGYTKGTIKNNYRPWWNTEIKQKRKARREANRKKRQLERRKEMGKEQNMREIIKARNEYQKKKVEAQREINKAMMEEEDRKLEEMRRKKSNREY